MTQAIVYNLQHTWALQDDISVHCSGHLSLPFLGYSSFCCFPQSPVPTQLGFPAATTCHYF